MALEIRLLRQLLTLHEHGNFARAARHLGITQPALSRSVQSLEARLGTRLFDRGREGVVPTDVGKLLLQLARPIVNESHEAERQLRQLVSAHSGQVRIGAGPYPADISVGQAVGILSRRRPGARIDLSVGDWSRVIDRLFDGDLDVAIAETSEVESHTGLEIEPLPKHRGVLFVRSDHPLARQRSLTLERIGEFPLALTEIPGRLAALVRRSMPSLRRPTGQPGPDIRVDTFGALCEIVRHSDAIGCGAPSQIRTDLASGRIATLPLELSWLTTNYGIIRLAGRTPSPLLVEFMNTLREVEEAVGTD
jgi:DNA-binding transcriptional LysR family regulator